MAKAKKRGNGEGSITKRKDGRWWGRYTVQTANGARQKAVYGKTRAEAAEKLTKAMSDRDGGLLFDAGNLKLGEYLDAWLPGVRDTVRPRTFERYEQIVRDHLKPPLGRVRMKSLTPAHVRQLYREKLDEGLSPRTVQYVHTTLHKALKQAVMDGLVPRNVTEAVKSPKPVRKEVRPLTSDQARTFLETVQGDPHEALYVVALHCGLRQGELLGLRWEDVDLEARSLSVRRTLSITKDGPTFAAPKTAKSRRNVRITNRAADALKTHRKNQNEERLRMGTGWSDRGLVFPGEKGQPLRHNTLTVKFKKLLARADLPSIRFHDLRHTCATMHLKMGSHPKKVQELLGHATIAITLDTYSHVLPGMGDELADAMDDALG